MRYPEYFLNKNGNIVATKSKECSSDGTPRYICNPKTPENTYSIFNCLTEWHPVYKYYVNDKVEWVGRFTKQKFDCIVKNVKRQDNLMRIVADNDSMNPMPYSHYYAHPNELKLKQ